MTPIRPQMFTPPQAAGAAPPNPAPLSPALDRAREAQRAFFAQALGQAAPAAAAQAQTAPQPAATTSAASGQPARDMRPGSLLDIRV